MNKRKVYIGLMRGAMILCTALTAGLVLSLMGYVLINGKKAYVVGRICMDQMMVDVSHIDCKMGDEVILIGKDGGESITADNIAAMIDTIGYEIICGISKRVPRNYLE